MSPRSTATQHSPALSAIAALLRAAAKPRSFRAVPGGDGGNHWRAGRAIISNLGKRARRFQRLRLFQKALPPRDEISVTRLDRPTGGRRAIAV